MMSSMGFIRFSLCFRACMFFHDARAWCVHSFFVLSGVLCLVVAWIYAFVVTVVQSCMSPSFGAALLRSGIGAFEGKPVWVQVRLPPHSLTPMLFGYLGK